MFSKTKFKEAWSFLCSSESKAKNEKELSELKQALQKALERIEKLEHRPNKEGDKLYRYFIPEYDADNNKVSEEKRMDYLNVLQETSCKDNGGYTIYEGEGGYYPEDSPDKSFNSEKIVREKIIIFETYGENPMKPERLKHCQKFLYQNSLGVMSSDSYEFIDSNKIGIYDLTKKENK